MVWWKYYHRDWKIKFWKTKICYTCIRSQTYLLFPCIGHVFHYNICRTKPCSESYQGIFITFLKITKQLNQIKTPQTKPIISIVNVVASASIGEKLDLQEITKKFPDTEYHPEQFPGLVFRLKVPKTATLVFRTGKMVCTGSTSEEFAIKAVNW